MIYHYYYDLMPSFNFITNHHLWLATNYASNIHSNSNIICLWHSYKYRDTQW